MKSHECLDCLAKDADWRVTGPWSHRHQVQGIAEQDGDGPVEAVLRRVPFTTDFAGRASLRAFPAFTPTILRKLPRRRGVTLDADTYNLAPPLVLLNRERPRDEWSQRLSSAMGEVSGFDGDVSDGLHWAAEVGQWAPQPGDGETPRLWELLASTAAIDVGIARVLEPHLDALSILEQVHPRVDLSAIGADSDSTWGVYAAEGPNVRLTASRNGVDWVLDGVKPWCSLASSVTHALVTAHTVEGSRRLFAVNLRETGVQAESGPWVSRGLRQVVSAPVRFDGVPAVPVGADGWYLERAGFEWGGMGVAACWWGGASGVSRALYDWAQQKEVGEIALAHVGAVDTALNAARTVLSDAASEIDRRTELASDDDAISALRVRNFVAETVESTLTHVAHALGPAPLTVDEPHARRAADLQIYVRQHHAERDLASLGRRLTAQSVRPW